MNKKTLASCKTAEMHGRSYLLDIVSVCIELHKGQALGNLPKSLP